MNMQIQLICAVAAIIEVDPIDFGKDSPRRNPVGMCVECKEYTQVIESCCGAGVWVEGAIMHEEDLEETV